MPLADSGYRAGLRIPHTAGQGKITGGALLGLLEHQVGPVVAHRVPRQGLPRGGKLGRFRPLVPSAPVLVDQRPVDMVSERNSRAGAVAGYMLTVLDGDGAAKHYPGQLSADGQTLTFPKVNLALAGKTSQSIAFVAIRATDPDTTGRTSLTFQIGTETTQSTPIEVGAR
ncbi:hypothetical protein [Streptomyces sp. S-9]|uniref:hypothetical protein n=1 Tax=Streptomyces sp. S-9 TaxID=2806600 RepID=UPI00193B7294|nr:hypothetical protein [Streptomyces sp. S-9]